MRMAGLHTRNNRWFFLPVCVVGIAALLLLLAWFGTNSTAFAQDGSERPQEGQEEHREPEGESGTAPQEEHRETEGESGAAPQAPPQAAPQIDGLACMTRILGRVPAGPNDFNPEDRLRIVQECFGGSGTNSYKPR